LQMWHALGHNVKAYGFDINPECKKYEDEDNDIFIEIEDQGDKEMWKRFSDNRPLGSHIDVIVDDGSHIPAHQFITLNSSWPLLNACGTVLIEDIHNDFRPTTWEDFWKPAAEFLAEQAQAGQLESVHVYPYMLFAQRTGVSCDTRQLKFDAVMDMKSLDTVLKSAERNATSELKWEGILKNADDMFKVFETFRDIHTWSRGWTGKGSEASDVPASNMQRRFRGFHIFHDRVLIEEPGHDKFGTEKHGDDSIPYGDTPPQL